MSLDGFHFVRISEFAQMWVLFLVLATTANAARQIAVGDQWSTVIERNHYRSEETWQITTSPGSKIRILCLDFRLPKAGSYQESCQYVNVTFDDGTDQKSFCENNFDFDLTGNSSTLTIELKTLPNIGGFLECMAKSSHPPRSYEEVIVDPGQTILRFRYPEVTRQSNDKAWRFRSTTGNKISIQCEKRLEGPRSRGTCFKDVMTIDDGSGPVGLCGSEKTVAISKGTEITMRVETFLDTESYVDCMVQGITGPNPNEYENIHPPAEDDSIEHGTAPGRKQTSCECGKANRNSGRIINGTETSEGKYPFMVSMRFPGGGHFCGGSILSPVHIMTAAHCVSDRKEKNKPTPADLEPVVGAHLQSDDASHGETQRLKVKHVSIPDEWFAQKGSLAGDIAILHLETPIRYSKWVSPVCLTPIHPNLNFKFIKAIGWGATETGGPSDPLLEAHVRVLDRALCNNDKRETCFKTGPSSTCFGDSGGPYVWVDPETNRYTQVALVSYGYGDFCNGAYFIGTNVVHWYDWIQKTMATTSSSHNICRRVD